MDKSEALAVATETLLPLRRQSYDSLVSALLNRREWTETIGPSGSTYRVQVQAFWDDNKPGNLRVMACADDGSRRGFSRPACSDFIFAPDGSFVGEAPAP